jgi:hypothetical protein
MVTTYRNTGRASAFCWAGDGQWRYLYRLMLKGEVPV